MTGFLNTLDVFNYRSIQYLTLKVVDERKFTMTELNFHYMDLKTLKIDAEGCCLDLILIALNCRCWTVENLYLRGDVTDLASIMMYVPQISNSITIINTNDSFVAINNETEHAIRYLMNSALPNVELCNLIKFCCSPPSTCSMVQLFICGITSSHFCCKNCTWKIDRLQVDMIKELLATSMNVRCGVFQCEMEEIDQLQKDYPGQLHITSVA
tara:strand:+ start:990 stop:1625 length:636 start_codon:yes stop_codon:yes gene_type:complete